MLETREPGLTRITWDRLVNDTVSPGHTALAILEEGRWEEVTYEYLARRVTDLSSYLLESGLSGGERVAILSESRPEWGIAFLAVLRSGAAAVPLDPKLTQRELSGILAEASPKFIFASASLAETAESLVGQVPSLEKGFVLNGSKHSGPLATMDSLVPSGVLPGKERDLQEVALITYTSGTTGTPKGVMTTFGNLLFQTETATRLLQGSHRDVCISILPLNHLLELTGGFLSVLYAGGQVCYSTSLRPQTITSIMAERRVTRMVLVPQALSLLKGSIEREARLSGRWRYFLFRASLRAARWIPSLRLRRLLFRPLHRRMGGALSQFLCGGAPLDTEVARFFQRLGIAVYQGYGLTETSPVVSVNTPGRNRLGSVGQALPGVSVRILPDPSVEGPAGVGEILTTGPHLMKGYYRRDDLTREVIDEEGWFHSGDLGFLDRDGYLYVTGRVKNLIVLSNGKKVVPEEVEEVLSSAATMKEFCVLGRRSEAGDGQQGEEEVYAVAVPQDWLVERHPEAPDAVEDEIKKEIRQLSQQLAPHKRPTQVVVRREDLPRTATRKVRRPEVLHWLDAGGQ